MRGLRRLFQDNLANRTLFVLIVGLSASHVLSTVVYIGDRDASLSLFGPPSMAEHVSRAYRLLDELPPALRPRAAEGLSGPVLTVRLGPEPPSAGPATSQDAVLLERLGRELQRTLPPGGAARAVTSLSPTDPYEPHPPAGDRIVGWFLHLFSHGATTLRQVQVSLPLADGSLVSVLVPVAREESHWSAQFLASLLLMGATVVFAGWWLVRRFTRSLSAIAEAARNIGLNRDAAPMAVAGPLEVRLVAEAFNTMRDRLARFVSDRTQMLAAISHDLRTPITRLRLRSERVEDPALRDRMLHDLQEMEKMIASSLAFARNDAEDEPSMLVDVAILVRTVCDEFTDTGKAVDYAGPDRLLYECRPSALSRAVSNLVDNAVEYGGGAELQVAEDAAAVTIAVRDRGPGIPEAQLEHVFLPYVRLDPSRSPRSGNSGLGLSIARSVVHAHGGTISLANHRDGGLVAAIILPKT